MPRLACPLTRQHHVLCTMFSFVVLSYTKDDRSFSRLPDGISTWTCRDLASSRESSIVRSRLFFDPGRAAFSRPLRRGDIVPGISTAETPAINFEFRGSIAMHSDWLFTLHREDYSLPMQNSLPAAGQALPRRLFLQGTQRKVLTC